MAKLSEKDKEIRQNEILNFILNYPGEYSVKEIANIFEVTDKTIRSSYGKLFEEKGVYSKSRKNKFMVNKIENEIDIIDELKYSKTEMKLFYILFLITINKEVKNKNLLINKLLNIEEIFENTETYTFSNYLNKNKKIEKEVVHLLSELEIIVCEYDNENKNKEKHEEDFYIRLLEGIHYLNALTEDKNIFKYRNLLIKFIKINNDFKEYINKNRKAYIENILIELHKRNFINIINGKVEIIYDKSLICNEYALQNYNLEEIKKLLIFLNLLKEVHPKISIYRRIFDKLTYFFESYEKNIVTIDKLNGLSVFDELKVKKIQKAILEKKALKFNYKSFNNEQWKLQGFVNPLGIIYNHYKDQWYLNAYFGKGKGREERVYRFDRILNLQTIDEIIEKEFSKEKFEQAIGINVGKTQEVEVHFDNMEFIKRKIEVYCRERKDAIFYEKEDILILKDNISGMTEFETWVRGFGKSAKCIKPINLITKIKENTNILKERYKIYE